MNKVYEAVGKSFVATVVLGVVSIFSRAVGIFLIWVGALVVEWLFGGLITRGVAILFPSSHFVAADIPPVMVVTYLIGVVVNFVWVEQIAKKSHSS